MTLSYNGTNVSIRNAVTTANQILANAEFYNKIAVMPVFAYSTYDGQQVNAEMTRWTQPIIVDTYWNPFSGATAKTQSQININTAKLNRSNASIVNTLVHESVHYIDWNTNQKWDYGDRNVYEVPPISAPYSIGALAEQMAS